MCCGQTKSVSKFLRNICVVFCYNVAMFSLLCVVFCKVGMFSLLCVCVVWRGMFCHYFVLVLCPIVLSLSRVVLCFFMLKGDWMER